MDAQKQPAQASNGFIYYRDGGETPGQNYARVRDAAVSALRSNEPRTKALISKQQDGLLRLREIGPGQVQDNRFLSNLSVQYRNDDYIGLALAPVVQTPALAGEYPTYDKRFRLGITDDSMSGRSTPNEVSDGMRGTGTYSCLPKALKSHVSVLTLKNQVAPLDEMINLTESVTDDMLLNEESRIATFFTSTGSYAATNTSSLSGVGWDVNAGAPVLNIQTALAALWMGKGQARTLAWCGLDVWNALSRNQQILDLFKYGGTAPGLATPDMICKFFDIDGLLVGRARQDTANIGQTASYSRIWGKSFGVARVAKNATIRSAHFASTFRFGTMDTSVWFDQSISTLGGYWSRVSVHEQHAGVANDTGYLFTNVIA